MSILSKDDLAKMRANSVAAWEASQKDEEFDPSPVVKLFNARGGQTWLLTEIDDDMDRMFGLCDLGMGEPELGYVSLGEISDPGLIIIGAMIEKDLYVILEKPLSYYTDKARIERRIVT